ncbi:hypothetical protein KIN20_000748 [Parelaphostrongylus tenuis]|uniref:AP-3 complex subunit delta domain-containing protein n=1 Tax=Parelaphostrongylus tenuis TaxID=148309 RepID=A0AAD5ML30_PARTN|nr:hypothetical protein KIN20_000748 [Parelaphostrongylus tenuis]
MKAKKIKESVELSPSEIERRRKARQAERENNPYYVKGTATAPKRPTRFMALDSSNANTRREVTVVHKVNRADGEMPEDAKSTDEDDKDAHGISDEFRALDINLDEPLRPDEVVRGPQAYNRQYHSSSISALVPRAPTTMPYQDVTPVNKNDSSKKKKREKLVDADGIQKEEKEETAGSYHSK